MPKPEEEAIRRSLREQHPDWPQDKIDHVVYGHLENEGKMPHRSRLQKRREQPERDGFKYDQ